MVYITKQGWYIYKKDDISAKLILKNGISAKYENMKNNLKTKQLQWQSMKTNLKTMAAKIPSSGRHFGVHCECKLPGGFFLCEAAARIIRVSSASGK